jgi:uncharacterized membrane protein YbaN (DUF454 family)
VSPVTDESASSLATRRARPVRAVFFVLGTVFLCLAALGIVVPVLPTTPFVLLAAACYLRASTRLHDRLLRSRTFGPTILAWQEHRAIPPRAKALAIVMVTATFAISVVFVFESFAVRAGLTALGAILVIWLARRPSWSPAAAAEEPSAGSPDPGPSRRG